MNTRFSTEAPPYSVDLQTLPTHLPADTNTLLLVFEYCTVRQWPVLLAEAGLPQTACLVSTFHTTMLRTQRATAEKTNSLVFGATATSSGSEFIPAVVLAAEGNQIPIIRGEVHGLHLRLVKLQLAVDSSPSVIPYNYTCLGTHTPSSYLSDN